jgi:hypothetical protein
MTRYTKRGAVNDMTDVPPAITMLEMATGFQVSQALYAAAELDIAGLLVQRPRTVVELAEATDANPDALGRLIRYLESIEVFRVNDGIVEVTDLGEVLAEGVPGSARGIIRYWMATHYAPYADLMYTIRTGEPAATHYLGKPFFDWVSERPEMVELQNAGMESGGEALREAALADYMLPGDGTVADIGGADGNILSRLLAAQPDRRGIVFDLPDVVDDAHTRVQDAGLGDRVEVVGGDFFKAVPTAEVYVMSSVLHDWTGGDAIRILESIARAAPRGARLVLLELVVPEDASPHYTKSVDLTMMTMVGGRERTATEWRELLDAGGFRLDDIIEHPAAFSIIEATAR